MLAPSASSAPLVPLVDFCPIRQPQPLFSPGLLPPPPPAPVSCPPLPPWPPLPAPPLPVPPLPPLPPVPAPPAAPEDDDDEAFAVDPPVPPVPTVPPVPPAPPMPPSASVTQAPPAQWKPEAHEVSSLQLESTMVLVNDKGQQRERRSTGLIKLQPNGVDSKLLVRFSTPADIKGTSFLQVEHIDGDDDLWIYLPALKKSRRLVANNKKDSFVGSDFSYGDISLPKVDQYRHTLVRSEKVDGFDCYVVESVPASEAVRANSGYSKKLTWVRTDNFVETKVEYYDLAGRLWKTQTVTRHELVEPQKSRWFALQREMTNHQNGHRTADQLGRQRRQLIVLPIGPAKLHDDVLTVDEAGLAQALAECSHKVSGIRRRPAAHEADHRQRCLLRAGTERPGRRRTAKSAQKIPPPHIDP